MDTNYIKEFSDKLKTDFRKISHTKARNFILKNGYSSSSFMMPEYYSPAGFNLIKLDKIKWKTKGPKITKTLDVLTPKSYLAWRSFNLLNPYIFLHIALELTDKKNWKLVKKLLSKENLVYSYSVPIIQLKLGESVKERAISTWLQMAEKDMIKDCTEYNHLTVTDIKNFYPTIYTHSIAWAFHGKLKMKKCENRKEYKFLGNKLDKLFQNSRDGQTNGIPVGSIVSDIVAETLLTNVDNELSEIIKKDKLFKQVLITRYRDDYRILSKTEDQGRKILQYLNKILKKEYDLDINSDKTNTYNDIIEYSFRPWMIKINSSPLLRKIRYGDFSDNINMNYLKDCLIETYRIQKEFPGGRVSLTVLTKLAERLLKKKKIKLNYYEIPEIISLLRKITLLREEVTPQVFLLFDILLKYIKLKKEKIKILNGIKRSISDKDDQDYQLIWFYRLCFSHLPEMCPDLLKKNKNPLLRIVSRKYYKHDYEIFNKVDFSSNDENQLKKFIFIDRKKLNKSKGFSIPLNSIRIHKY